MARPLDQAIHSSRPRVDRPARAGCTAASSIGSRPSRRTAADRDRRAEVVEGDRGGVGRRAARRGDDRAERDRLMRPAGRRRHRGDTDARPDAAGRAEQLAAEAATGRAQVRRQHAGASTRRRVRRRSRRDRRDAGARRARRSAASTAPVVGEAAVEVALERGDVDRRRPIGDRGLDARRVGVAARREPAVGAAASARLSIAGIRTGSSAGPSAARWPAARSTSSPSMRTANVSGSTSMSGSGVVRAAGRPCRATGCRRPAPAARRTSEPLGQPVVERGLRRPTPRDSRGATAGAAPNIGRGSTRLRGGDRGVGVAHRGPGDHAALDHDVRADAEERRVPQHEVGQLADLDRADLAVAARGRPPGRSCTWRRSGGPAWLSAAPSPGKRAAAALHHVRGLPGAQHDLADAAHRLRVRADHRDRAQVVEDVLGGDRRRADAALGEGQVLGHGRVEVVAHHQHVEVLVDGVDGVRPGRVGRRRQHVGRARRR